MCGFTYHQCATLVLAVLSSLSLSLFPLATLAHRVIGLLVWHAVLFSTATVEAFIHERNI